MLMSKAKISDSIDHVYEVFHDDVVYMELWDRLFPEDKSMHILTVLDFDDAAREVSKFMEHIRNRRVVELGAGVGLLAYEMAKLAKSVVAVEFDPVWARVYLKHVYPKVLRSRLPLYFTIGDARHLQRFNMEFDVAVIYTYSAIDTPLNIASKVAKKTILNGKVIK